MNNSTKHRVLALLEQQRDKYLSGQAIAAQLQLSRNAVWKAIKQLQSEGHSITAVQNRGYCLANASDILSVAGIAAHLAQPCHVHIHSNLESTNQTAKQLAVAGAQHGTIVVTNEQTAGRGRYTRSFASPAGGIYFSMILQPNYSVPTLVTAHAAVAVCQAVEQLCGLQPTIKWVNDVLLGNKKLCGILTEAITDFETGQISWIVVGIGINFTQTPHEHAACLFPHGEPTVTRNAIIAEIVNHLLTPPPQRELLAAYELHLSTLGETVRMRDELDILGKAIAIDENAALLVRRPSGEIITLNSGEVSIVTL
ncbi:MAG: biotin--[acetyl-CoA-carboxylase] ligase [Oscillospiraceae bacterium]|nr:biotin--[acetyl-CoA-carboxylase] ligase [Oscillospiraceae bacterium]